MKKKFIIICFVTLVLFNIFSVCSFSEDKEVFHWVTQTCHPLVGPLWDYVYKIWADKVIEMSGGRIQMDLHASGEIVPGAEIYPAVRDGLLDAAVNSPGYIVGRFPALEVMSTLPGGLIEFNDLIVWLYGAEGSDLMQELYGDDVIVFPLGITPSESFWTNKKVEKLEDFKGLKFRSAGVAMEFWDRLGASVIMIPGGEIVPAMQRKLIDATDYLDPYMDYKLGLHEVSKYYVGPPEHMTNNNYQLIINPKSWEALPDDLKAIVKNAATAASLEGYCKWSVKSAEYFDKIKESGVTILKLSKEEQDKAREIAKEIIEERSEQDEFYAKTWESWKNLLSTLKPYNNFTSFDK